MIIKKGIKELVDMLGGYVSLADSIEANIGDWPEQRMRSRATSGITDSDFDQVSRRVVASLSGLSLPLGYFDSELVDIFEEALANSVSSGNGKDPSLKTYIKILECKYGYILRIRDMGKGFDIDEIMRLRDEGLPGSIHNSIGEGTNMFRKTRYPIIFTNNGTIFNLVIYK